MAGPRCRDCGGRKWSEEGRCVECRAFPTLGFAFLDLVESVCVVPDREEAGQPLIATDEQASIFLQHYRINPHTVQDSRGNWRLPFWYPRGSQVTKPQKWGKAPVTSMWICGECHPEGPVLFDGWDAEGQPVGRPWPAPHFQVAACSEDQTDNIWRVLQPMIELGPLADVFLDVGLTRINLPTGGLIEPVTAAAISRLGARIHGAAQDQTESWVQSNGGHRLRDAQRRGLAGTGGRFLETPNAWDPADNSVAQQTFEHETDVYKTYETPPAGSVRNKKERHKVLQVVYGDSTVDRGGWIDLDRIHVECEALLEHDPSQAERWFMNRCLASEGAAFDVEQWKKLCEYDEDGNPKPRKVPSDSLIVIGVDGARHDDALAIVACEVRTGYVWPLDIIERPENAPEDYRHDKERVDGVVRDAFGTWPVWRMYCDPQHIADLIAGWKQSFSDRRVIEWETYRPRPIAWAVRNFETAVARGEVSHSGDEVLTRHVGHARRRKLTILDDKERQMHTLSKDGVKSPRKIDGAMAAVLAWEARGDCLAAGGGGEGGPPLPPPPARRGSWLPGEAPAMDELVSVGPVGPMGGMS